MSEDTNSNSKSIAIETKDKAEKPLSSRFKKLLNFRPFHKAVRHYSQFDIQPDDPYRHYGPGDLVTGNVILQVDKPFDLTHIVICLHGFVQAYRTPNNPGEGYRNYNEALVNGRTNKAGGFYGNGFQSLFEDELILCGDGRIETGKYQFGFELQFPDQHLPSGIDFERGTVTYMITCTITRPSRHAITNPVATQTVRLTYIDDIDIALLVKQGPKELILNPIPKKPRSRSKRKKLASASPSIDTQIAQTHFQPAPTTTTPTPTPTPGPVNRSNHGFPFSQIQQSNPTADAPGSPTHSELSFESAHSGPSNRESASQNSRVAFSESAHQLMKPVVTQIEINSTGFLRGDTIDVKVSIDHNKHIKSLHGIIVTLFRHSRVDYYPQLPIVNSTTSNSRHILRGPSFASGGHVHVFRKVLDQNHAALITNPQTLQAIVKVSVTVPEDTFPTISTVPGAMVSFKYIVEIICDLKGKLSPYDKYLSSSGSTFQNGLRGNGASGAHKLINTEEIRRTKDVIYTNYEIVVGSRDSKRVGAWSAQPGTLLDNSSQVPPEPSSSNVTRNSSSGSQSRTTTPIIADAAPTPAPASSAQPRQTPEPSSSTTPQVPSSPVPEYTLADEPAHPYEPIDESQLSEKERVRLHEQRVMPSAPPGMETDDDDDDGEAVSVPRADQLLPLNMANVHHFPHLDGLVQPDGSIQMRTAPPYVEDSPPTTAVLAAPGATEFPEVNRDPEPPIPHSGPVQAGESTQRPEDEHAQAFGFSHGEEEGLPKYEQ
jgi:hypothetical protein